MSVATRLAGAAPAGEPARTAGAIGEIRVNRLSSRLSA